MSTEPINAAAATANTTYMLATANSIDAAADSSTVRLLTAGNEAEVLAFLAERPLHTVFMAGFIRDNGLESALNRGAFYACRNSRNRLEGVALLGHATLVEARTEEALAAFAEFARGQPRPHVMMGEQERISRFWQRYAGECEVPHLTSRELLLEQRWVADKHQPVPGLRTATLDDIVPLMHVNANLIMEECGVNPMQRDPVGFRVRMARRIEQSRVWVWINDGQLIFKADITSETPEVIYLEGVYVVPEARGRGYGSRCFAQMCRSLLARTVSICLLVDEANTTAQTLYYKAGFELRSRYDTIYIKRT